MSNNETNQLPLADMFKRWEMQRECLYPGENQDAELTVLQKIGNIASERLKRTPAKTVLVPDPQTFIRLVALQSNDLKYESVLLSTKNINGEFSRGIIVHKNPFSFAEIFFHGPRGNIEIKGVNPDRESSKQLSKSWEKGILTDFSTKRADPRWFFSAYDPKTVLHALENAYSHVILQDSVIASMKAEPISHKLAGGMTLPNGGMLPSIAL